MTRTEGRTALAAAVLALLGGLLYLAGLVLDVVALVRFPADFGRVGVHTAVNAVLASTLLPGGVLLLRRHPAGRIGCIAGSSAAPEPGRSDVMNDPFTSPGVRAPAKSRGRPEGGGFGGAGGAAVS